MTAASYKEAAVIVTSRFVQPGSSSFKEYVNYIDRKEAIQSSKYALYNDYMEDEEKATSLFTESHDRLDQEHKEKVKDAFKTGQNRGSILYQDVVSFDNKWLEDNGIYNRKTKTVDEQRLKDITRVAMKDMHEKNNMGKNLVWSGAIHHNTDNVHIHLATVDLSPPEDQRGKRKQKTLDQFKSVYIHKINDRSKEYQQINELIRKDIVNKKKETKTFSTFNRKFKKDFMTIYKQLPINRKYWNYGYQTINHVKPELNKLTKKYVQTYHKKDMEELEKRLDKEVEMLKKSYGKGGNHRHKDFKKNKLADLEKRMGNAFLAEMREYDKKVKKAERANHSKAQNKTFQTMKRNAAFNQMRYGLDRAIHSEMNSGKNKAAYEEMQRNIERGYSR
ncbi:MobP2 family relaxase [Bacillus sp. FJAT-44742]|uniref:MobP2 family relaxase n=1 Tax=Bacillus sp. FJAT-44742 TaxID=2014005 RepID=UPI000C238096|nr:MobP2 family relaxase [Bacillus sp. FJAT-44742]